MYMVVIIIVAIATCRNLIKKMVWLWSEARAEPERRDMYKHFESGDKVEVVWSMTDVDTHVGMVGIVKSIKDDNGEDTICVLLENGQTHFFCEEELELYTE